MPTNNVRTMYNKKHAMCIAVITLYLFNNSYLLENVHYNYWFKDFKTIICKEYMNNKLIYILNK